MCGPDGGGVHILEILFEWLRQVSSGAKMDAGTCLSRSIVETVKQDEMCVLS